MEIKQLTPEEIERELNPTYQLEDGKCIFTICVNKPEGCKIEINDIEQSSIVVDKFEKVTWKVSKKGYKTSLGEYEVRNSVCFILSLKEAKPKPIKNAYTKWSLNDKEGYVVERIELYTDTDGIPPTEGKDNCYLFTKGDYIFWKKPELKEFLSFKESDIGKYLKATEDGYVFDSELPNLPTTGNYVLKSKDSEVVWEEDHYKLPELPEELDQKFYLTSKNNTLFWSYSDKYDWGDLTGDIRNQLDLMDMFSTYDVKIDTFNTTLNELRADVDSLQVDVTDIHLNLDGTLENINKKLDNFKETSEKIINEIREEVTELSTNLTIKVDTALAETKKEVTKLVADVTTKVDKLEQEVDVKIETLDFELRQEMSTLKSSLTAEMKALKNNLIETTNQLKEEVKETEDNCIETVNTKTQEMEVEVQSWFDNFSVDVPGLHYEDGHITSDPDYKGATSKEIKQLLDRVDEIEEDNTKVVHFIDNFDVQVPGLKYEDYKITADPDNPYVTKSQFDSYVARVEECLARQNTLEFYIKQQLRCRLTVPDYTQIEYPVYDSKGFFLMSKNGYALCNSNVLDDYIDVYSPKLDAETGLIIGVGEKITRVVSNSTGSNFIQIIPLTRDFYYKVSNRTTMKVTIVGELPYGLIP